MKICPVDTELFLADGRTDMAKRRRIEHIQFNNQIYNTLFDYPTIIRLLRKFLPILLLM